MTRRELDAKLADLENSVRHLMVSLPRMANDIAALRAQLAVPPQDGAPEPRELAAAAALADDAQEALGLENT